MSRQLIIPSAEPFFIPGGKTGCLLIHGFTGTPKEMRMLGESLAGEGYTILAPRLFGHATSVSDIRRAHWQDWVASVEDGLHLLRGCTDRQFVMGLSMGGILAMITAARHNLTGAVTFSAPGDLPADPISRRFLPVIGWLNLHINKGKPDWRNPDAARDHIDYPYYPTSAILELNKLIKVMRSELGQVKIPTLLVQSRVDQGIPSDSLDYLYENISSLDKTAFWVENSGHVVIREPEREKIFDATKSFMKRVLRSA